MRKILSGIAASLLVAALLVAVTNRPTRAEGAGASSGNAELSAKVDEVLRNQKDIIQRLDNMKEDIRIIKLRITQIS